MSVNDVIPTLVPDLIGDGVPTSGFVWPSSTVLVYDASVGTASASPPAVDSLENAVNAGFRDLAEATNKPDLATFGAHDVLVFNRTSADKLINQDATPTIATAGDHIAIWVATKIDATNNGSTLIDIGVGSTINSGITMFLFGGNVTLRATMGVLVGLDATYAIPDTTSMHIYAGITTAAGLTMRVDGVDQTIVSGANTGLRNTHNSVTMGCLLSLVGPYGGQIALAAYAVNPSAADYAKVNAYIEGRFL